MASPTLMEQLQALEQVFPNLQVIARDVIGGTPEQNQEAIRRLDQELANRRKQEKTRPRGPKNLINGRQLFP